MDNSFNKNDYYKIYINKSLQEEYGYPPGFFLAPFNSEIDKQLKSAGAQNGLNILHKDSKGEAKFTYYVPESWYFDEEKKKILNLFEGKCHPSLAGIPGRRIDKLKNQFETKIKNNKTIHQNFSAPILTSPDHTEILYVSRVVNEESVYVIGTSSFKSKELRHKKSQNEQHYTYRKIKGSKEIFEYESMKYYLFKDDGNKQYEKRIKEVLKIDVFSGNEHFKGSGPKCLLEPLIEGDWKKFEERLVDMEKQ